MATTGLAMPTIPSTGTAATVVHGHCTLLWNQLTAISTVQFAIVTSAAPTGLWVTATTKLSTATAFAPTYTRITTAATTNVTGTLAPSAFGVVGPPATNVQVTDLDFVLAPAAGTPVTLTIDGYTQATADHLNVVTGSSCGWLP